MANIGRRWKRILAIGCSHGHLINQRIEKQVLAFREAYDPHEVVHLGDVIDTAAFRQGARGTADQGAPILPDKAAALGFIERLRPTRITWGNHDHRLVKLQSHPEEIVRYCAGGLWNDLQKTARAVGAKTYPYHYRDNICKIGGVHYMHGISHAKNATEIHAKYCGGRVVHAHTHRAGMYTPEGLDDMTSFSAGMLADANLLTYAHERLATGAWRHGMVFGEFCETESVLWLVSSEPGKELRFPMALTSSGR